jgi:hypothetical protein
MKGRAFCCPQFDLNSDLNPALNPALNPDLKPPERRWREVEESAKKLGKSGVKRSKVEYSGELSVEFTLKPWGRW